MPPERMMWVLRYASAYSHVGLPWQWEAHSYLVCNNRLRDLEKSIKLRRRSPPPTRPVMSEQKKKEPVADAPAIPPRYQKVPTITRGRHALDKPIPREQRQDQDDEADGVDRSGDR